MCQPRPNEVVRGNETLLMIPGDRAVTTHSAVLKPGIIVTIEDAYIDNGFARYYAGGVVHRQQDLVKLSGVELSVSKAYKQRRDNEKE